MSLVSRMLIALLAISAGGCVLSDKPLFGPETRVVPFTSGSQFEVYERANSQEPWKKRDATITLTANADSTVSVPDIYRSQGAQEMTFHSLSPGRFLIQIRNDKGRYAYLVLETRQDEDIATTMICNEMDQEAFRRAGGTVKDAECNLDSAPDPAALLKQIASNPRGPQHRYVPVKR